MKFKCKECGNVYDKQVEYCECGNNTFEFIDTSKSQKLLQNTINKDDMLSWVIFSFCIILSCIIFLIPVPKNNKLQEVTTQEKSEINIPDFERIWKDSTPPTKAQKSESAMPSPEPIVIIQKIIRKIDPVETGLPKKTTSNSSVKKDQPEQNIKRQNPTPKSTQQITKSVPKNEAQSIKTSQVANENVRPKPDNSNNPELIRYKNILRELLLSKLTVGNISGEGTCIIEFGIDSTGKLINRKFAQYANNKSMNDAIYYMLMSVPKFQPPPAAYSGETIRMKFYVNNGAYEISFL